MVSWINLKKEKDSAREFQRLMETWAEDIAACAPRFSKDELGGLIENALALVADRARFGLKDSDLSAWHYRTCPKCGALPGRLCVGIDGAAAFAPHDQRCRR